MAHDESKPAQASQKQHGSSPDAGPEAAASSSGGPASTSSGQDRASTGARNQADERDQSPSTGGNTSASAPGAGSGQASQPSSNAVPSAGPGVGPAQTGHDSGSTAARTARGTGNQAGAGPAPTATSTPASLPHNAGSADGAGSSGSGGADAGSGAQAPGSSPAASSPREAGSAAEPTSRKQLPVEGTGTGAGAAANTAGRAAGPSAASKQLGVGAAKDLAGGASMQDTARGAAKSAAWKAGPQWGLAAEGAQKAGDQLNKIPGYRASSAVLAPTPDSMKGQLGAGGTSYVKGKGPGESADDHADDSDKSKNLKRAGIVGAAAAVPAAGIALNVAALIAFMKSLFFSAMAAALNVGQALLALAMTYGLAAAMKLGSMVMSVGKAVLNFGSMITGGLTAGAAAVGTVATAAVGGVTTVSVLGMSGVLLTGMLTAGAVFDDRVDVSANQCTIGGSSSAVTASTTEVSADTEKNAQIVYSVLSEMGMSDENIAGILGNWSQESGIDATSVEGIFSEPFQIGDAKKKAWDGDFTHIPGQQHGGIGLGQWSNGRTPMLLEFAEENNADWHAIDTQLAFMASGDNPSDVAVFKDMIENSKGSPEDAARFFHDKWERSADNAAMMAERQADAKMWMGKMSGWEVDPSAGSAAKSMLDGLISLGTTKVSQINSNCAQESGEAAGVGSLQDGGVEAEEARRITELYNKEGDQVLGAEFGGGGPGKCNGSYIENCTSFSWYFITKYTTYDRGYAPGNGVDVASAVGSKIGKQPSATPKAYSVFSNGVGSSAGHTGVVLSVDGDRILIGEASYCQHPGRVRWVEASEWQSQNWEFLDVSDMIRSGAGLDGDSDDEDGDGDSLQAAA